MKLKKLSNAVLFSFGWLTWLTLHCVYGQAPNVQQIGDIQFTLAPGLVVERVAGEPLVKWPVVADWDSAGRLVIVESGGVAKPIEEHNKQLLHRIVRLIDDDHDGSFDRRIVAADKLPFPEGVLCLGDSLLVAAPPHILKLTDNDADGICEQREIWFDGQTITGCANDLHGPYLGRDGWIYWCKGAFAEQTHQLLDGSQLTDSAAHIYRRRLTGGPIEPVMNGGMDNPVEVAITPEGERFFTSTFLQHPGDGLRDGIAHAIYGGVYGKQQRVIEGLLRTGPLMPIMTQLGPAAPSGLACLESTELLPPTAAAAPGRTLVAALFNLQKVTAHRLQPTGASFKTDDIDLLVANRIDFHPTDILEDADGSLLVIDTGGWYGLCCPTSRVDQQTAAGGIYRIRRQNGQPPAAVSAAVAWNSISTEESLALLDDPRPWISRLALLQLAETGNAAVAPLQAIVDDTGLALDRRLHALWALSAIGTSEALEALVPALESDQASLMQAACHAISVNRYRPAKAKLEHIVSAAGQFTNHPQSVVRAAAEALGRVGDAQSISHLMEYLRVPTQDQVLRHSLLFAMLELKCPEAVAAFADSQWSNNRLTAMEVLGKLGTTPFLQAAQVIDSLADGDSHQREAAIEILSRHPEWIDDALPAINTLWQASRAEHTESGLAPLLTAWRDEPALHQQIARWIEQRSEDASELAVGREERGGNAWAAAMGRVFDTRQGLPPPPACVKPLWLWLHEDPATVSHLLAGMDLSAEYCQPLVSAVRELIETTEDVDAKFALVACLPANHGLDLPEYANEVAVLFVEADGSRRAEAETALQRLSISASLATQLVEALANLAPRQLPAAIEVVSSAGVDAIDSLLLAQLAQLASARTLPANFLENIYRGRNAALKRLAKETAERLLTPTADIAAQVDQLLEKLPPGDAVRGLEVFRSTKAACAGCHQMGYVGGKIGPELTRIGQSRTRPALLEALLFPSSRIEQSYQPTKVLTVDGQIYNGLVKQSLQQAVQLQLTVDKTIWIAADDIERQEQSDVSIMPGGMREVLTEQDIADLLALLEAAR